MQFTRLLCFVCRWPTLLLPLVIVLGACGGGTQGGNTTPPGGGGSPPATGFAVFVSDRTTPLIREPWIASFDGTDYRSLAAGLPGDGNLRDFGAWLSPDGRYLAVITQTGNEHQYAILETATGASITLPFIDPVRSSIAASFFWSPDSSRITFIRSVSTGVRHSYLMNADGSNLFELLPSATDNITALSWSPAGTHFVVIADPLSDVGGMPNPDEDENLYLVSADGATAIDMVPAVGSQRNIIRQFWAGDGSQFVFEVNYRASPSATEDSYQILAHDMTSGTTLPIVLPGTAFTILNGVSNDGNWVSYIQHTSSAPNLDILYVIPSSGGAGVPVAGSAAGDSVGYSSVSWAPVGDKLAYVQNTSIAGQVTRVWHLTDPNGNFRSLHADTQTAGTAAWSPDGRYLAFNTASGSNGQLYVVDTTTADPPLLLTVEPEFQRGGSGMIWSPDGLWLYAVQYDEVQQKPMVRTYPTGNWSAARTLGDGGYTGIQFSMDESRGALPIFPTPDSTGVVWRRTDPTSNTISQVMFGDPTDPILTRELTQGVAPSAFGRVGQLFPR